MPTVTLVESAKLSQDMLIAGLIENVITVNAMYQYLPFQGIEGNALAYNRENVLGTVATVGIGDTDGTIGAAAVGGSNQVERAAAKNAATFTKVTSSLTTIMGDAEVNGLIQATRSNEGNDQTALQISSKAKSAGRKYQDMLINGDGNNQTFAGLITLCAAGQKAATGTDGRVYDFDLLDELMDLVTDKDGQVDYFAMPARTIRTHMARLRALGGTNSQDAITLPGGGTIPAYRGVPMFRNDYIPTNVTKGSSTNTTYVFAGTLDDGSMMHGIAGLTASSNAGLNLVDVGESETKDERIWRVKWYCGLALFSEKGLALADGVRA
jgi:hypothetical protein